MNRSRNLPVVIPAALLTLAALACLCSSQAKPTQPTAAVAPLALGDDLTQLDICQAIPQEDVEAVMGVKLSATPQAFDYDITGASGCTYEAGKDSSGAAYFAYVVFTPAEAYSSQPLYLNKDVIGLGQAAYFNNGGAARELWVKVNDQAAFVVGIGDNANEEGALALARLVLAAIQ
jgi:hypothetical protein